MEGRREQIKHAAEKGRGSEMSCQTGEVGVEMLCSYRLSISSYAEMREMPRDWKNSNILTDFIMHMDKHHCTSGSRKLLWHKVVFTRETHRVKGAHSKQKLQKALHKCSHSRMS